MSFSLSSCLALLSLLSPFLLVLPLHCCLSLSPFLFSHLLVSFFYCVIQRKNAFV